MPTVVVRTEEEKRWFTLEYSGRMVCTPYNEFITSYRKLPIWCKVYVAGRRVAGGGWLLLFDKVIACFLCLDLSFIGSIIKHRK